MAITIKQGLTENEIKFMEIWIGILKHKSNVSGSDLDRASKYVNFTRTGSCSSCMRNDGLDLNNIYKRLINAYNLYLSKVKVEVIEPLITEPVETIKPVVKKQKSYKRNKK